MNDAVPANWWVCCLTDVMRLHVAGKVESEGAKWLKYKAIKLYKNNTTVVEMDGTPQSDGECKT